MLLVSGRVGNCVRLVLRFSIWVFFRVEFVWRILFLVGFRSYVIRRKGFYGEMVLCIV